MLIYEREKSVRDTGEIDLIEKNIDTANIEISYYSKILAVYKNTKIENVIYISDFIEEMPGTHYLETPRDVRIKIRLESIYKGRKIMAYSYITVPKNVIEYELNMKLLYPNN